MDLQLRNRCHVVPLPLPYFSFRLSAISESRVAAAANADVNSDRTESVLLRAAIILTRARAIVSQVEVAKLILRSCDKGRDNVDS